MATILLLDHRQESRDVIAEILRRSDHLVYDTDDTDAALEIYGKFETDIDFVVIVETSSLPKGFDDIMDFTQLFPDCTVVAICSSDYYRGHVRSEVAKNLGAHFIVTKPYTCAGLMAMVETVLASTKEAAVR